MLPKVASALFAGFLIAGVPILSLETLRQRDIRLVPRTLLYLSAVLSQWVLASVGAVVVAWLPRSLGVAGLRLCPAGAFVKWVLIVSLIGIGGSLVTMAAEEQTWWPRETEITLLLMPATVRERLMALILVAPTAGICEEFLYRGFLISTFYNWLGSLGWAWALSSAIFALAHVYQGRWGMLRVGLLGALLAWPAVATGSLYPSMAAHFLIDAVALLWIGPRFLSSNPELPHPVEHDQE